MPLWDSLKRRFLRHFRALFGVDERSRSDFAPATAPPASDLKILEQQPVPSARPGWLRPSVGEHVWPPRTQVLEDSEDFEHCEDSEDFEYCEDSGDFEDFIPQESHTHTENDFNAVPVDSGKIQYTVVGTQRPKPR